ncbi:alpha/beta hydrolase [Streptomyces sp. B-S-A8]|uniref:Alpha/beta hydrolase n=1 Tax=Streptomyces solicavernae TaxID=3043614 RepID=A0ABT6S1F3_9ACTN|nr:alpha/beta hydrolase [Streptomyces sp. B-S-A8]MDI3389711.1 alpha/beta hydrolase [Streptomyces sp. B-S-A8]
MTSFDSSPTLNVWRALLALAVVFVMLATTGWSAVRHDKGASTPLERALSAWKHGGIDGHRLPDPHAPAARIAHFFDTLTGSQKLRLARSHPLAVGNLAGAPVTLRYQANRIALDRARGVERQRMHDKRLSEQGRHQAGRRMNRFESLMRPERQILAFDPMGPGRVAEVLGDLNRAERVSVVVPGVDTNLLTFQKTHGRYTAPRGMAGALYREQQKRSPKTRSAVIAWADYTAPAGLGMDAATAKRAEDGSVRLNSLVRTLPGASEVALYCHSYGSVVCGVAARKLPPRVTDIAVAGSPGMRAENVGGLHTDARVWAMRDSDDWIQDVPHMELGGLGHGADPVSKAFGARVVSAQGAVGHTGYFQPGTESLRNFARIGVGQYDAVSCAGGGEACRDMSSGSASA